MKRDFQGAFFVLFFFTLLLSCETCPEEVIPPVVVAKNIPAVIQKIKERAAKLKTVQAVCQVNSSSKERQGNFSAVLLVQHPNQFRLVGYRSFLGSTTILDLLLQEDKFSLYLPTEEKLIEGTGHHPKFFVGKEMLTSFFGITEGTFILLEETKTHYFFAILTKEGYFQQTLKAEKKSLWIKEQTFYQKDGSKTLAIVYQNYQKIKEMYWPFAVDIFQFKPEQSLKIRVKEVELNIELQPAAFVQEIPEEVQREVVKEK